MLWVAGALDILPGMRTFMASRKPRYIVGFGLAALLVVFLWPAARQVASAARGTYESLETFNTVLSIVQKNYVDDVPMEDSGAR